MWCMFTNSCPLGGRRSSAITTSVFTTPPARSAPTTPSYMKRTWWNEWTRVPTLTFTPMDESRCLVWASWTARRQREVYPTSDWNKQQSTYTQTQYKGGTKRIQERGKTQESFSHCGTKRIAGPLKYDKLNRCTHTHTKPSPISWWRCLLGRYISPHVCILIPEPQTYPLVLYRPHRPKRQMCLTVLPNILQTGERKVFI